MDFLEARVFILYKDLAVLKAAVPVVIEEGF